MTYSYDSYGWLTDVEIPGRITGIAPPSHGAKTVGQFYPNWTGVEWVLATYVEPVPYVPPVVVNVWDWFIDIGPFMDRFGNAKFAVLLNTDPIVQALIRDMQSRKWIDLQRADVAVALAYMHGTATPLGTMASPIAAITTDLTTEILTTPVAPEENMALRKLYFS